MLLSQPFVGTADARDKATEKDRLIVIQSPRSISICLAGTCCFGPEAAGHTMVRILSRGVTYPLISRQSEGRQAKPKPKPKTNKHKKRYFLWLSLVVIFLFF